MLHGFGHRGSEKRQPEIRNCGPKGLIVLRTQNIRAFIVRIGASGTA